MEILTQSNDQSNIETIFDRKSRENYFEMLEVALRNLSIVDRKNNERRMEKRNLEPILNN